MKIEQGVSPGQVLQRLRNNRANATIHGTCQHTGPVIVRAGKKRWVGQARAGTFIVRLKGLPVGGPYKITFSAGQESLTVERIWVGDVWLMAGQSNMAGWGLLRTGAKPHPLVHAMYMDDHWDVAREPMHVLIESPDWIHWSGGGTRSDRPTPAECAKFRRESTRGVGPGIFFGREMVKRSAGVPQGLLACAHGGTNMEQWDPAKKNLGGKSLYGSMLRTLRLTGQPIAGVLWYQGEGDSPPYFVPLYARRMVKFVAALRRDLKQPALPFLTVQIGRWFTTHDHRRWNAIQVMQNELPRRIRYFDVVTAVDLPLGDWVHVETDGLARLGVRLARLADRLVYGNRRELPAPALKSVTVRPGAIDGLVLELKFRNVVGGLRAAGEPTGFELVDQKHHQQFAFFRTTLAGDKVILETKYTLPELNRWRLLHGYGSTARINITDARDMALPVFGGFPVSEVVPAFTPFIKRWRVSRVLPAKQLLALLPPPRPRPEMQLTGCECDKFTNAFMDQHAVWEGKRGRAFFFTAISLSEAMKLNVRVGFDGPIKVWIDDVPVFVAPDATNPAIADAGIAPVDLRRGKHRLAVAMDLNDGCAWGFMLRFDRRDLTKSQAARGQYAVPTCTLRYTVVHRTGCDR